jgi:hypothetical protein
MASLIACASIQHGLPGIERFDAHLVKAWDPFSVLFIPHVGKPCEIAVVIAASDHIVIPSDEVAKFAERNLNLGSPRCFVPWCSASATRAEEPNKNTVENMTDSSAPK